jgi:hypothetical protein
VGTSGSFGGSRSAAWSRARASAGDLSAAPSDEEIERLAADLADALNTSPDETDEQTADRPPGAVAVAEPTLPIEGPTPVWGPISARRATGRGEGGPAGGGGGGQSGRAGPGTRGGGRRSRAAAARSAGRAIRVAYAVARGDAAAVARFGFVLAELAGLAPAEQARRIAEGIVGATLIEAERDKAIARTLIAILESGGNLPVTEAARLFVESYVYEVMLTEIDGALRDGNHSEDWCVDVERRIRDVVRAAVATEPLDEQGGEADVSSMIEYALERGRAVLVTRNRSR